MKVEPERDQWGRYRLPHPDTGEVQSWTRATTIASTLNDTYALEKWKMRQVALGIASNKSLRARLEGVTDKSLIDAICQEAMDRVGASDKADIGTALHGMCEQLDLGEAGLESFSPEFRSDLRAYLDGMHEHGVAVLPSWVERIVINPPIVSAGTLDRIVKYEGSNYIADIKTGSLDYSLLDISIQLAIYANSTGAWTGEEFESLPDVSKEYALVLHLPAGQGKFALWAIDIERGWELAKLSFDVRLIQKETPGTQITKKEAGI